MPVPLFRNTCRCKEETEDIACAAEVIKKYINTVKTISGRYLKSVRQKYKKAFLYGKNR